MLTLFRLAWKGDARCGEMLGRYQHFTEQERAYAAVCPVLAEADMRTQQVRSWFAHNGDPAATIAKRFSAVA
jgi:hypothetical protein